MRPILPALALALAVFGSAIAAPPRPLAANHPFVGTWIFAQPHDGCVETFVIRPDGTTRITSGDETVETRFDVSDRPDSRGAYRWDDKVVKGNGKRDCGDAVTRVGQTATNWLRFDPTGDKMALCADAALRECVGPYVRSRRPGAGSTRLRDPAPGLAQPKKSRLEGRLSSCASRNQRTTSSTSFLPPLYV